MHGNDCRKILIKSIKKNVSFLQIAITSIYSYLNTNTKKPDNGSSTNSNQRKKSNTILSTNSGSQQSNGDSSTNKTISFRKSEIDYAHFVHSINVIRKILCFQNGRLLFPIKVLNKEGSLLLSDLSDCVKK